MIYTSYFGKLNRLPKYLRPVGVCRQIPKGINIPNINELSPTWDMINLAKAGRWEAYCQKYNAEVLDRLDPVAIYNKIGDNAVLMCYEKTGDNCHRHLIADWLNRKLGLNIVEYI